jgi:hypothetical protein
MAQSSHDQRIDFTIRWSQIDLHPAHLIALPNGSGRCYQSSRSPQQKHSPLGSTDRRHDQRLLKNEPSTRHYANFYGTEHLCRLYDLPRWTWLGRLLRF